MDHMEVDDFFNNENRTFDPTALDAIYNEIIAQTLDASLGTEFYHTLLGRSSILQSSQ
jgi:hypothetical protein